MSKQFLAVIAAVVILFAGLAFFTNKSDKTNNAKSTSSTLTEHKKGAGTTGVTLVEYADYECPYCEQYYPTVKQVVDSYGDKITYQFRNFPLTNAHPNAFAAARAAEAAGLQGDDKFWAMHDALYDPSNWQNWTVSQNPNTFFNQYAEKIGLNVATFKTDFASQKVNDLVNGDLNQAYKLNLQGTPSFFVDGKQVDIANNPDAFKKVIDAEIKKKQPATVTDTKASDTQPAATSQQ